MQTRRGTMPVDGKDDVMVDPGSYPIPPDEPERLVALQSYAVMGTEAEPGFDAIVGLARRSFGVPMAMVSFVAADRQFFKARAGLSACGSSRAGSFCTHTILSRDVLVVPDATLDDRFRHSPLVTGPPYARFYAGAPLVSPEGHVIGALCIQDTVARHDMTQADCLALADLADMVMERLEARRLALAEADGRKRFDAVAGLSVDAIICADGANTILSWNGAAERMFGYTATEAIGRSLSIIVPPAMRAMHEAGIRRVASGGAHKLVGSLVRVPACRRDGTEFPIELSLSHWTEAGQHRFGAIARDITERVAVEEQLQRAADFDNLTGLANRASLFRQLADRSASGRSVDLLMLDLDGFKDVNDSLGHAAGDAVLKAVATRIAAMAGPDRLVCRLGGDEFVVVAEKTGDLMASLEFGRRVIADIERPIEIGDRSVYIGASAGLATTTGAEWAAEALLADADLALYRAKQDGRSRVRLFTQELRPVAQSRASISSGLRQAWERGEFELYYQPQVRLSDAAIVGAEALIRWNHPQQGVVAPGAFLCTLEQSLLAIPVSEWILGEACRQAAEWRRACPGFRIGVNLFAVQFKTGDLLDVVGLALDRSGLAPEGLELEITENTILGNEARITSVLDGLRSMGVGIAFDDYGTGYASLTMLKDFPVSRLKIDRSFVSGPGCGARDVAIVDAISRLAATFDLEVIAEGIETAEQHALMRPFCAEGQGYLFGKPMPADAFTAALAAGDAGKRRVA
ncbi:putative bifunctional diguanylate cyclase/phosphodiesterase [Aureimonas glaciei]|nr:EAL domain-containing protein [Aureimonas glaciei]